MGHWFDDLTRGLASRPLNRRDMLSWSAKLGLAVLGGGLAGRLPTTAFAAPAPAAPAPSPASAPTTCAVSDSYGVLTSVVTASSNDASGPLSLTHSFIAEVGSGMTFSTLTVTPATSSRVAPDDVVLRMTTASLANRTSRASVMLGHRLTGTAIRRSNFSTDGRTISGTVDGQPTAPIPSGLSAGRLRPNAAPSSAPQPAGGQAPQGNAAQRTVATMVGQATSQFGTCSPDPSAPREVATCTQCQLTCRQAWLDCALPAIQSSLAAGALAPSDYLSVASATCDPALQLCLHDCKSSGACCPSFCNGDATCCQSAWGCCPPSSHGERAWSRTWPTCPRCGPPPWTTPSTTSIPQTAICSPRPPVLVTTRPGGPGMLQVTVSVTRPPTAAPNNTLKRVEIGATRNASVEIAGQTLAADGAALPLVPGSQSTTFVVRRQTPGQAVTVPLTVTDDCGAWKTFVGGGLAAF